MNLRKDHLWRSIIFSLKRVFVVFWQQFKKKWNWFYPKNEINFELFLKWKRNKDNVTDVSVSQSRKNARKMRKSAGSFTTWECRFFECIKVQTQIDVCIFISIFVSNIFFWKKYCFDENDIFVFWIQPWKKNMWSVQKHWRFNMLVCITTNEFEMSKRTPIT